MPITEEDTILSRACAAEGYSGTCGRKEQLRHIAALYGRTRGNHKNFRHFSL
jgi:hypothetical protein